MTTYIVRSIDRTYFPCFVFIPFFESLQLEFLPQFLSQFTRLRAFAILLILNSLRLGVEFLQLCTLCVIFHSRRVTQIIECYPAPSQLLEFHFHLISRLIVLQSSIIATSLEHWHHSSCRFLERFQLPFLPSSLL